MEQPTRLRVALLWSAAAVASLVVVAFLATACGGGGTGARGLEKVRSLERRGDVHGLVVELRSRDPAEKSEAALALGRLRARSAVPDLIARLGDLYGKSEVVKALVEIGDRRAVTPLVVLLGRRGRTVTDARTGAAVWNGLQAADKSLIAWWLGTVRDPRTVVPLLHLDPSTCSRCGQAIVRMGKAAVPPLLGVVRSRGKLKDRAIDLLARIGKPAVPTLVAALHSRNADVGGDVADCLGRIGDARAERGLEQELTGPIRLNAANALATIFKAAPHHLVPLLEQPSTVGIISDAMLTNEYRGVDDHLIAALNAFGNEDMAFSYLNCGRPPLEKAAEAWAKAHGYTVHKITLD